MDLSHLQDPVKFLKLGWPDIRIYDKQAEILYSVRDNDITVVPAGNMLGKDFISAACAIWFFNSRQPAKVVTSSVDASQLNTVLWGEMRRFVQTCRFKLPMELNNQEAFQLDVHGARIPLGTMIGRVSKKGEGMLGQHIAVTNNGCANDNIPRTLMIWDEASGIDDANYETALTWAQRVLVIGNPFPCENFFRKAVREGDVLRVGKPGYNQKIIHIQATDSPNVKVPMEREKQGLSPLKNETIIPGLITYETYKTRLRLWDDIRICISLMGRFYEGKEILLYPPDWLNRAEEIARRLVGKKRIAKSMGVDTAEGGDQTVWVVIDEYGILELVSLKTPDTSIITGNTLALMKKHRLEDEQVLFDRGGGGKQHSDRLRAQGHNVRSVGFGEAPSDPNQYRRIGTARRPVAERQDRAEDRYVYKNRRAEMYGLLRFSLLDPINEQGFGIPAEYTELRRQLAPMPLLWDAEGRMYMLPKDKPTPNYTGITLKQLLGCSPDEADALVLAVFGLFTKSVTRMLGAY